MKKKLITFATAAAMAAPVAVMADAHAQGPDLYGRIHTALHFEMYDNTAGDSGGINNTLNSSRVGLRGSESLDGGMTAFYQFEHQFEWDGFNTAQLRDTFVGIRGDFGSVRVGRLPALNAIVYGPGNFFPAQAGEPGNILWSMGLNRFRAAPGITSTLGGRFSRAMEYSTALPGPVQVAFLLAPSASGDEAEGFEHNYMLRVNFNEGPISAQGTVLSYYGSATVGGVTEYDNDTMLALQGDYDMGGLRVGGGFATVSSAVDDADDSAIWAGGAFDLTATGTLNAQLSMLTGDADDTNATVTAVGFTEALSSRTSAYGNLALVSNDDGSTVVPHSYGTTGPQTTIGGGESGQVVSVGVVHNF